MRTYSHRLFWKGFSNENRNRAIHDIEATINKYAYITDFKMFSDLEISISIEIEESNIDNLYHELEKYITLKDRGALESGSTQICVILLNLTFLRGTGNLEHSIPSVPG
jgi:hypothetical protein